MSYAKCGDTFVDRYGFDDRTFATFHSTSLAGSAATISLTVYGSWRRPRDVNSGPSRWPPATNGSSQTFEPAHPRA
jgi:hypothetical protein